MFNTWRSEGFPRDQNNIAYNRYLFARKTFRTLAKKCKNQATADHFINIEKLKKTKQDLTENKSDLPNQMKTNSIQ